jgi:hypothetical protein
MLFLLRSRAGLGLNTFAAMSPKEVLNRWLDAFNTNDAESLAGFYADFATNHQTPNVPVVGRNAIQAMYADVFAQGETMCIPDNIFEDGEWAILECYDHKGFRSCAVFHVIGDEIVFQRGYWDQLSFLKLHQ